MRPPVTLVHNTTTSTPHAMPVHPETRAAAAFDSSLVAARNAGYRRGERAGVLAGWRSGWLCGMCWGCVLTAIALAAARSWGWV